MSNDKPTQFTRRNFVILSSAAAATAFLGRVAKGQVAQPLWIVLRDLAPGAHELAYAPWMALGYRPASISIYGSAASPLLASVWVRRNGPLWSLPQPMTLADLNAFSGLCQTLGYRIRMLSATGTGPDPRFVALAEASTDPFVPIQANMTKANFVISLTNARNANQIPRAVAFGGTELDPRYTVVYEANSAGVLWNLDGVEENTATVRTRDTAMRSQLARPAIISANSFGVYASLFKNDMIDGTVSPLDVTMTAAQLDAAIAARPGSRITQLEAYGSGGSVRYSAIFQTSETIRARTMRRTATDHCAAVTTVMDNLMTNNRIRQGTLQIVRNKKLVYSRSFTRAEPVAVYPDATHNTHFRLASISKTLTALVVLQMVQRGELSLNDRLVNRKTFTPYTGSLATNFNLITIGDLLGHRSGIRKHFDTAWAAGLMGKPMPLSAADAANFVCTLPLDFRPGTLDPKDGAGNVINRYSNIGYMLLGQVVEARLNLSFFTVLQQRILTPLGITRLRIGPLHLETMPTDEAKYDDTLLSIGPSKIHSDGRTLPYVYGADFHHGLFQATGGLSASGASMARILAALNTSRIIDLVTLSEMLRDHYGSSPSRWGFDHGLAAGPANGWKSGGLHGTRTNMHFVQGGISFFVAFNKGEDLADNQFLNDWVNLRNVIASAVPALPDNDLFQSLHGMAPL